MSSSFSDFLAIIDFLVKIQKKELEIAIQESGASVLVQQRLREYFSTSIDDIQSPSIIQDRTRHANYLCKLKSPDDDQPYTDAYKRGLQNNRKWDRRTIESIMTSSASILERMPDPNVSHAFDGKGLVIGHVQSGKTASMAALMSRAADHGYKLVIVLAGLLKDLRYQTQNRLDQDVTGIDDDNPRMLCVDHLSETPRWMRLTSGHIDGDFRPGNHDWDPSQERPKLAVIKKNTRVLESFTRYISTSGINLMDFPALIIDDEADHASINTKANQLDDDGNPIDPSATNRRIRDLLEVLPKCTYVGYTATPFANVLIDHGEFEDLYPKDFICILDEPQYYFGARQLFGLGMTPSDLSPEEADEPEFDILRYITPDEEQELDGTTRVSDCPNLIQRAFDSFWLSCCGRFKRGEQKHMSMLIHPSRLIDDQQVFAGQIEELVAQYQNIIQFPRKKPFLELSSRMKELWDNDFCQLSESLGLEDCPASSFDEVWRFHKNVINELEIIIANSQNADQLEYSGDRQKIYVVIGGNKLSRGVTLEGLSVSVFFRNTPRAYDTLLQMGRWFGYRRGYQDLTRIFVSQITANAFADLARVELELREDLKKYTIEPDPPSPLDIQPMVRAHNTLMVTSPLKMGAGRRINVSLQHHTAQTVSFPLDNTGLLTENITIVNEWLKRFSGFEQEAESLRGTYYIKDVKPEDILELIGNYHFGENARRTNKEILTNYIERQLKEDELITWDIVLPRGSRKEESARWTDSITTHKVRRKAFSRTLGRATSIKILHSPQDIDVWRKDCNRQPHDSKVAGIFLYMIDKKSGQGTTGALFDDPSRGEDLVGFAISFPRSDSNATIEYVTQEGSID